MSLGPKSVGNQDKPWLCLPEHYLEDGTTDYELCSMVAWDHVSWPGNDFNGGARATDDGVKAAATDVMSVMTGVEGAYHLLRTEYVPPAGYPTWGDVITEKDNSLSVLDRIRVFP